MKRKACFFDIDNTLVPYGENALRENVKKALRQAQANGHLIFVSSGRTKGILEPAIHEFEFDGFILACGAVIEIQRKIISTHVPDLSMQKEIVKHIKQCRFDAALEGAQSVAFIGSHNELAQFLENNYRSRNFRVISPDDPHMTFEKFCIFFNDDSDFDSFYEHFGEKLEFIKRSGMKENDYFYEITCRGISKATGIDEVCEYFGLTLDDCYAFGDSTNDLTMLKHVKHSIAMGNCDEELKPIVEFVTTDSNKDGIEHALRHYGLI